MNKRSLLFAILSIASVSGASENNSLETEIAQLNSLLHDYDLKFASLQSKIDGTTRRIAEKKEERFIIILDSRLRISESKKQITAIENEISSFVKNPAAESHFKSRIAQLETDINEQTNLIDSLCKCYRPLKSAQDALAYLDDEMTRLKAEKEHASNKLEQKLKELRSLEKAQRVLGIPDRL